MPSQGWAVRFVERNKSTIDFGDTIEDSDRCIAWSTFDNYEAYFNVVAEHCVLPSLETSPNKKLVPIPVKRARAVQHKRVGGHAALLAVKGGHRPHLRKFQLKSF